MGMATHHKNRLRSIIRVTMVFIAVILLFFSVGIPIINNAIALGIEGDLKRIPLPADTTVVESTSVAGKLTGNGNGMQYFGAVLLKSERSLDELYDHYRPYRQGLDDCLIELQTDATIRPRGEVMHGASSLSFRTDVQGGGYYILYTWGSASDWARDLLDTDLRGH